MERRRRRSRRWCLTTGMSPRRAENVTKSRNQFRQITLKTAKIGSFKNWSALPASREEPLKFWWDFLRRKNLLQNFGGTSCAAGTFPKILAGLPPPEKVSPKFWRDFRRRKKSHQNFGGTSAAGNNPTKTCVAAVLEAEFPPVWWAARRDGSPYHLHVLHG